MELTGKLAYAKVLNAGGIGNQRMAIFKAYCDMHDNFSWVPKDGVTIWELLNYLDEHCPATKGMFPDATHVNKHQSFLRRVGVLEEGPKRICHQKEGTTLYKTHKITGRRPVSIPKPKTLAKKFEEVQEQIRYMDVNYMFEDADIIRDFTLLKVLAGVE